MKLIVFLLFSLVFDRSRWHCRLIDALVCGGDRGATLLKWESSREQMNLVSIEASLKSPRVIPLRVSGRWISTTRMLAWNLLFSVSGLVGAVVAPNISNMAFTCIILTTEVPRCSLLWYKAKVVRVENCGVSITRIENKPTQANVGVITNRKGRASCPAVVYDITSSQTPVSTHNTFVLYHSKHTRNCLWNDAESDSCSVSDYFCRQFNTRPT
jgi:hypothetical protein